MFPLCASQPLVSHINIFVYYLRPSTKSLWVDVDSKQIYPTVTSARSCNNVGHLF